MKHGICAGATAFLLLVVFWTPKVYTRLDQKAEKWRETLFTPIWKDNTDKFMLFEVPGSSVVVAREELGDFKNAAAQRGHSPKQKPYTSPVTDHGYVLYGWNGAILAGYALISAGIGALAAGAWEWAAGLRAASGTRSAEAPRQ